MSAPISSLSYRFEPHPSALILHLKGDAGILGIDELAKAAFLAADGEPDFLLIEASGLSYIGSMGVGVLMRLRNSLTTRGGHVAIIGATPEVKRLLNHLRIERVMPLHASLEDALRVQVLRPRVPAA